MRKSLVGCAVLLCVAFAASATADPVTVTSGTATVFTPGSTFLSFDVAGDKFTAVGTWALGTSDPIRVCGFGGICTPGSTVTLSTTVMNDSLVPASVGEVGAGAMITANGTPLNEGRLVELLGAVNFTTSAVTLPLPGAGETGITVTAPFTLSGTVSGYNPFARDPALLFTTDVAGGGLATLRMAFNPTNDSYTFGTLR